MQWNVEHATAENKRQRRPSVRLNQPYYVNPTRGNLQKKWDAFKKDLEGAKKAKSKRNADVEQSCDFDDDLAIGNWKSFNVKDLKLKRKRKRKMCEDQEKEESLNSNGSESEKDMETREESEEEQSLGSDGMKRNFDIEKSKEFCPSPLHNSDGGDKQGRRLVELTNDDGMKGNGGERENNGAKSVKMWLNELGLGKYESLFHVHEVDEQVLPFLTLEDLKDMGITAVGSKRKMYCSIQNLGLPGTEDH